MRDVSKKVCLVIPCHNEAKRLHFEKFKAIRSSCCFLFVNDGSDDNTLDVIKENMEDNMYILNLTENVGKGETVRQGMLYLRTLPIFQDVEWIGYWDADLSTPLSELNDFFVYSKIFSFKVDAIWGSRIFKLGSNIKRSFVRHLLGRLFATLIRIHLKVNSYDTQCGSKLFKKELLSIAFLEPFISKQIFDVEILLRLEEHNVIEYPVRNWVHRPGGPKILLIALRSLLEIPRIRRKYMRN